MSISLIVQAMRLRRLMVLKIYVFLVLLLLAFQSASPIWGFDLKTSYSRIMRENAAFRASTMTPSEKKGVQCLMSFTEMAFPYELLKKPKSNAIVPIVTPLPPWQFAVNLPEELNGYTIHAHNPDIKLIRSMKNHQEIWLAANMDRKGSNIPIFLIYIPETNEWNVVVRQLAGPTLLISELFRTRSGEIWGQPDVRDGFFNGKEVIVLSKFSEISQQFDLSSSITISVTNELLNNPTSQPLILLDKKDTFWIFPPDGFIYRFVPGIGNKPEKEIKLPDSYVIQAAVAADGSIFLVKNPASMHGELIDGDLLQYFPETGQMMDIKAPDESWPNYWYPQPFIDSKNRLWIDALGYRLPNGKWHAIFPNIKEYSRHLGDIAWAIPSLQMESSNGLLWFYKATDIRAVEGTAWYNPQTRTGCMFSNLPLKVFEDANHTLWTAAQGKLFKYSIH